MTRNSIALLLFAMLAMTACRASPQQMASGLATAQAANATQIAKDSARKDRAMALSRQIAGGYPDSSVNGRENTSPCASTSIRC